MKDNSRSVKENIPEKPLEAEKRCLETFGRHLRR